MFGVTVIYSYFQIVEIVHQYETTCLPPQYSHDKDAKVAYIKDSTIPKNCTQTLNVRVYPDSLLTIFRF